MIIIIITEGRFRIGFKEEDFISHMIKEHTISIFANFG
jgi:hypothetical protein